MILQHKPTQVSSTYPSARPWPIMALFAAWLFWGFGYETVWKFLSTDIDGTVISSHDVPRTGAPRYATEYVFQRKGGQEQRYIAGPTDASIKRSIPVGAHVRKLWGALSYDIDGRRVIFPYGFYAAVLSVGMILLTVSIKDLLSQMRERKEGK